MRHSVERDVVLSYYVHTISKRALNAFVRLTMALNVVERSSTAPSQRPPLPLMGGIEGD